MRGRRKERKRVEGRIDMERERGIVEEERVFKICLGLFWIVVWNNQYTGNHLGRARKAHFSRHTPWKCDFPANGLSLPIMYCIKHVNFCMNINSLTKKCSQERKSAMRVGISDIHMHTHTDMSDG